MRPRRRTSIISSGWSAGRAATSWSIPASTPKRPRRGRASSRINPVDALDRFGVKADTIRDVVVTHLHYDHAGNLDRFPQRALPSAGSRDELRHRALHVQRHAAASVFGRARHDDGAPRLWRARHLPFRRWRDRARGDRASGRRPFRRAAGGAGRDRARAGGAGLGRGALLRQFAEAQPVPDRLQCRRHGVRAGKSSSGSPAIPIASSPATIRS